MPHQADGRAGQAPGNQGTQDRPPRSSFRADLRAVLGEPDFRKLFAARLVSQTGDGIFNAGLGAYVFFSAQSFPDPGAAALAFAVLYLPYSLVGPFAGVFIDRWSRRQILVWSALARFVFVAVAASFVASGTFGLPLYIGALLVLGVNRFFLSSLSAALPHVVSSDKLVMANSVAPTSGTVVSFLGGILGIGVHLVTGGGQIGSAATLLTGGLCYAAAGLVATRMPRDLLGPDRGQAAAATAGVGAELGAVMRGLAAGARHVFRRRRAGAVLAATAASRFLYGILLLMSVLLYRNYFYRESGSNSALGHYLLIVIASAIGYGAAAVLTPVATRRLSKAAWITILLAAGGIGTGILGTGFRQPGFLVIAFLLGVAAQGVAICATTTLQQEVEDDFRGRVFSLYDMLFNGAFVAGAAGSALFMPDSGHSYTMLLVVAVGYVVAAGGFWLIYRQPAGAGSPGSSAGPAGGVAPAAPASAAQPRSS